ncbi:MAG: sigma factor-like helix-turn-helix DNA-binding protein [Acidimicrobiales bacterium]
MAGLTEPEIADLLGTKPGTVSSLLSRARTDLRRRLEDDR